MKTRLSSRGMIIDIGSMRKFAKKLLGKNKIYEQVLKELLKEDYYNDPELPMPTMKAISKNTMVKYEKVRNQIWMIYRDLTETENKKVTFRITQVKYGFTLSYFGSYHYFEVDQLPHVPRVGENIEIPFFKEKVGTRDFFVRSINHYLQGDEQLIVFRLQHGNYSLYWHFRKDEAYQKREISWDQYHSNDDWDLKKDLGLNKYAF